MPTVKNFTTQHETLYKLKSGAYEVIQGRNGKVMKKFIWTTCFWSSSEFTREFLVSFYLPDIIKVVVEIMDRLPLLLKSKVWNGYFYLALNSNICAERRFLKFLRMPPADYFFWRVIFGLTYKCRFQHCLLRGSPERNVAIMWLSLKELQVIRQLGLLTTGVQKELLP